MDQEPVSPDSSKGRERLARLRRRLDHLEDRNGGSFDRAEASALRWAIGLLEELGAGVLASNVAEPSPCHTIPIGPVRFLAVPAHACTSRSQSRGESIGDGCDPQAMSPKVQVTRKDDFAMLTLYRSNGSNTRWVSRKNYPSDEAYERAIREVAAEMEAGR